MLFFEVKMKTAEHLLISVAHLHQSLMPEDLASKFKVEELVEFYKVGLRTNTWKIYAALNSAHQVIGCLGISISRLRMRYLFPVFWKARKNIFCHSAYFLLRIFRSFMLYRKRKIDGRILFIFVAEECQGKGIGKKLLSMVSIESFSNLYVDTKSKNQAALKMYLQANYVAVDRKFGNILLKRRS